MIRGTILTLICTFTIAATTLCFQESKQGDTPKKQQDKKAEVPRHDADAISRRDFMRSKLMYSQNIFEGLTTGNFDQIEDAISKLEKVTEGTKWVAIDNDEYRKLTSEFNTTVQRLKTAAKGKSIDAMSLRFYHMSSSCIDCHQHIRKAGYTM